MATQQEVLRTTPLPRARMRWVKRWHIVVGLAVAILMAHAAVGIAIAKQSSASKAVKADLAIAQRAVAASRAAPTPPSDERARAQAQLASLQSAFPQEVNPRALAVWLMDRASNAQVTPTTLQTKPSARRTIGQHSYLITPISITVSGNPTNLILFTSSIERSPEQTAIVKGIQFAQGRNPAMLTLDLEVYARAPAEPASAQPTSPQPAKPKPEAGK